MKLRKALMVLLISSVAYSCGNNARTKDPEGTTAESKNKRNDNKELDQFPDNEKNPNHKRGQKVDCDFNLKPHQMNKVKRKEISNSVMAARKAKTRKPPRYRPVSDPDTYNPPITNDPSTPDDPSTPPPPPPTDPTNPPPPPSTENFIIMVDVDGHRQLGTWWGDLDVSNANIDAAAVQSVYDKLVEMYQVPFTIEIIMDEARFNAAPVGKRHRHIMTTSSEWYGYPAGGVAFIGSITTDQPSFTFTKALNFDKKFVAEAAAHEIGHALGLPHIAQVDESNGSCSVISGYHTGTPEWAWVMGVGYYSARSILGTLSSTGDTRGKTADCQLHDDVRKITQIVPLRPVAVAVR